MHVAEHIISLERSALDRWIKADPDGYLSLYATDATYFDPFREKRVDGLDELNAQLAPMSKMPPATLSIALHYKVSFRHETHLCSDF